MGSTAATPANTCQPQPTPANPRCGGAGGLAQRMGGLWGAHGRPRPGLGVREAWLAAEEDWPGEALEGGIFGEPREVPECRAEGGGGQSGGLGRQHPGEGLVTTDRFCPHGCHGEGRSVEWLGKEQEGWQEPHGECRGWSRHDRPAALGTVEQGGRGKGMASQGVGGGVTRTRWAVWARMREPQPSPLSLRLTPLPWALLGPR